MTKRRTPPDDADYGEFPALLSDPPRLSVARAIRAEGSLKPNAMRWATLPGRIVTIEGRGERAVFAVATVGILVRAGYEPGMARRLGRETSPIAELSVRPRLADRQDAGVLRHVPIWSLDFAALRSCPGE